MNRNMSGLKSQETVDPSSCPCQDLSSGPQISVSSATVDGITNTYSRVKNATPTHVLMISSAKAGFDRQTVS